MGRDRWLTGRTKKACGVRIGRPLSPRSMRDCRWRPICSTNCGRGPWTREASRVRPMARANKSATISCAAAAIAIGLEVTTDAAGNLYATLPGLDRCAPRWISGSHFDSVPRGGNYDGAAGAVAALASIAALKDPRHPPASRHGRHGDPRGRVLELVYRPAWRPSRQPRRARADTGERTRHRDPSRHRPHPRSVHRRRRV